MQNYNIFLIRTNILQIKMVLQVKQNVTHIQAVSKLKSWNDEDGARRDRYLFRILLNSKITYRPHCPGTGGGAFFYV